MKGLYWNTVDLAIATMLKQLMTVDILKPFCLVGGTALSLQLGHRLSMDIDLFTDSKYGSIEFNGIDEYLRQSHPYVSEPASFLAGMGRSYSIGIDRASSVKLDLYYTDPFIRPILMEEGIRMASTEDIAAMKMEVISRGGRKKDFWDVHELNRHLSIPKMIELHAERYPYGHDAAGLRANLTNFSRADDDFDPMCLRGNYWELIKMDLEAAMGK